MGHLTVIVLHNDAEHAFREHPEEFGKAILEGISQAQRERKQVSVPFHEYANYISVEPPRHADHNVLFLSKGNGVKAIGEYEQDWQDLVKGMPALAKDDVKCALGLLQRAKSCVPKEDQQPTQSAQPAKAGLVSVTPAEAIVIAEQTENAYSYSNYTPAGWRNCCKQLARLGYDASAIETIMRSKWTRWASDGSNKAYGQNNWVSLQDFMKRDKITLKNWKVKMGIA